MGAHARTQRLCALAEGGGREAGDHVPGGGAGHRIAAEGAAHAARVRGVDHLRATGHGGQRQAAGDALAGDQQVGNDIVVFGGEEAPGAAHSGLDLVQHQQHAVLAAAGTQMVEESRRERNEAAFALDRLDDHRGDRMRRHLRHQRVVEGGDAMVDVAVHIHDGRAAIDVGKGQAVDLGREGAEAALEQRVLAGHRHGEVGAPVVGALEHDQRLPPGVGAGELDRRLDRLGAAAEQHALLRKVARCHGVEQFADGHVGFVGGDDRTDVDQPLRLLGDRRDHLGGRMTDGQGPDAARKIEQGVAVCVGHRRAAAGNHGELRQVGCAAGDRRFAARDELAALRAGDFGQQADCWHAELSFQKGSARVGAGGMRAGRYRELHARLIVRGLGALSQWPRWTRGGEGKSWPHRASRIPHPASRVPRAAARCPAGAG